MRKLNNAFRQIRVNIPIVQYHLQTPQYSLDEMNNLDSLD